MGLVSSMCESYATGKRPSITRDTSGGVLQSFDRILFSDQPCNVQQASASTREYYAQRDALVSNTLAFPFDPGLEPNDVVYATNARTKVTETFLVQGQSRSDTHGRLWTVGAEMIRQPK